jgi:hypothetical protein
MERIRAGLSPASFVSHLDAGSLLRAMLRRKETA